MVLPVPLNLAPLILLTTNGIVSKRSIPQKKDLTELSYLSRSSHQCGRGRTYVREEKDLVGLSLGGECFLSFQKTEKYWQHRCKQYRELPQVTLGLLTQSPSR